MFWYRVPYVYTLGYLGTEPACPRIPPEYMVCYPGTPEYIRYLVYTLRVPGYLTCRYPSAPRVYVYPSWFILWGIWVPNLVVPECPQRVYGLVPGYPRIFTLLGLYF